MPNAKAGLSEAILRLALDTPGNVLAVRRRDGLAVDKAEILAKLKAGEPVSLEFEARTFIQRETPNANFTRFKPSILKKLGKSYSGQPFIVDHKKGDLFARGGTILKSEAVTTPDGVAFEMTIEAVKPWAIEGLLDGTIDRFSIGWDPGTADILCSACGESMWPASSCNHWPGDKLEAKDGSTKFVEAIFTSAEGTEVSAVSVPAVDGTGVAQIRAALAAHRSGEMPRKEGPMNKFQKLAKALGLSEDADVEMVASATLGKLSALEGALASKDEELKVAATKVATFERAQLASAADVLVEQSIRDGRLIPKLGADGKRIETPVESAIRDMVSRLGLAAAESYVGTLPKVAPVGPTALAEATAPARDGGRALSAGRQEVAKQLGLTEDQIQKGADRLRARGFGVA